MTPSWFTTTSASPYASTPLKQSQVPSTFGQDTFPPHVPASYYPAQYSQGPLQRQPQSYASSGPGTQDNHWMSATNTPITPGGQGPLLSPSALSTQSCDPRSHPSGMFTRNLIGSLCVSAFKLTNPENQLGVWFILQDLSVRTEGKFR